MASAALAAAEIHAALQDRGRKSPRRIVSAGFVLGDASRCVPISFMSVKMDARGVQRTLERLKGLAESAEGIGARNIESVQREPRLSDSAKQQLAALYREHALRMEAMYSELGASICDLVRDEVEDNTARGLVDLFHANFSMMHDRSLETLNRELGPLARLHE